MINEHLQNLCEILSKRSTSGNLSRAPLDWENLIKEAAFHRVLPLLVKRCQLISESSSGLEIDESTLNSLKEYNKANTIHANLHLFELQIISDILDQAEVPFIALKGLPLSYFIHNSIGARSSKDIDILVCEGQISKIVEILKSFDYVVDIPDTSTKLRNDLYKRYYNQFQAWHPDRKIVIEIHWRCATSPHMFNPPFNEIYAKSKLQNVASVKVRTLPLSETIVYLASHFSRAETLRLKWLCDFDNLLRRHDINPNEVELLARKYSCLTSVRSICRVSTRLFGTPELACFSDSLAFRERIHDFLTLHLLENRSRNVILAKCRVFMGADSLRAAIHDMQFILSPRIHDPQFKVSNYSSFYLFYFSRLTKLTLIVMATICKNLQRRLSRRNANQN